MRVISFSASLSDSHAHLAFPVMCSECCMTTAYLLLAGIVYRVSLESLVGVGVCTCGFWCHSCWVSLRSCGLFDFVPESVLSDTTFRAVGADGGGLLCPLGSHQRRLLPCALGRFHAVQTRCTNLSLFTGFSQGCCCVTSTEGWGCLLQHNMR